MDEQVPVVLLHGVGLDSSMWEPVIGHLARRAVAVDLPGHGSRRPLDVPATLAAFASDVLSRLPREPVHLIGFSLGALIALHIARFSPRRVRSLTCVSSVAERTAAERAAVLDRLQSAQEDFPATVERSLQRWYPTGSAVGQEQIANTRRALERNDVASFVSAYEIFATGDEELSLELGRIVVPTLIITGELDPGSTPEMTQRLAAAIPDSCARVIAGVRHMLPVEAPGTLVSELNAFIERVEGRPHD